jgi:hypothetical protein
MRIPTQEMPEVKNLVMNGDPMKKHEVILARYAGKMILPVPDTINGTGKSLLHEFIAMNSGDIPPRSADILWNLAMVRKKSKSAGNQMSNQVTTNEITIEPFNLNVPEDLRSYPYPGFQQGGYTKPALLLQPEKESDTPMLPIAGQLPLLHGAKRYQDTSKLQFQTAILE